MDLHGSLKKKHRRFFLEGGFTLIEICVTLLISLTLLAFTIPVSGAFSRQKLKAAADILVEDIRLTQKLNENQDNSIYTIKFDCGAETYYITKDITIYRKVKLSPALDLVGNNFTGNALTFNGKGVPSAGGTVTLGDKAGNRLYIKVLPATGRVRIDPSF